MITLHTYVGYLVLLLYIVTTIFAITSLFSRKSAAVPRALRGMVTGLLDLQLLLGLVTFLFHPHWGSFLLHPIIMIVVVALVHMLTSSRRNVRQQTVGYTLGTVLMILGISIR